MGFDNGLDGFLFEGVFVEQFDVCEEGWDTPLEARQKVWFYELFELVTYNMTDLLAGLADGMECNCQ